MLSRFLFSVLWVSHKFQADLKCTVWPMMTLDFFDSPASISEVLGLITGVHHHIWFIWCQGSNPGFRHARQVCQLSSVPGSICRVMKTCCVPSSNVNSYEIISTSEVNMTHRIGSIMITNVYGNKIIKNRFSSVINILNFMVLEYANHMNANV